MATDTSYLDRKYRRMQRKAINATLHEVWRGSNKGHEYRITIKQAHRSKGNRSDYTPVLTYWVFTERDGQPCTAMSATPAVYERYCKEMMGLGFVSVVS